MIDSLRAELAYRRELVRRDVATTRRGAAPAATEDRPATGRGGYRRSSWSAGRPETTRPAAPRMRPRAGGAVR